MEVKKERGRGGEELVCIDVLDIANRLPADGALDQSLGAAVARHVVTTRTENGRNPRAHADLTESLVLNVHQ